MGSSEITHLHLECGGDHLSSSVQNDDDEEDDESICFSEFEEGSCYSQFYSTVSGSRRVSSVVGSDCSVDFGNEFNISLGRVKRVCRICQMSVELDGCSSNYSEYEIGIELGCCCKNDLAAAHQHCAQTWFRIKGNMICEICNSTAQNVVGTTYEFESPNVSELSSLSANATSTRASNVVGPSYDIELPRHVYEYEPSTLSANADVGRVSNVVGPSYDVESPQQVYEPTTLATLPLGHWFVNFLLACMVLALVSWLFKFRLPQ